MEIKHIIKNKITVRDFLIEEGYSRSFRRKVRLYDLVYVNGLLVRNHHLLNEGDELVIKSNEKINPAFKLNFQDLNILYEDDYFLIINKEAKVASHPSRRHQEDNLVSIIAAYYYQNNIKANIHILTRLDYQTTGIVIVAKSGIIQQKMENVLITKKYLCKIKGTLDPLEGLIDLPIKRVKDEDIRRWVADDGQASQTKYKTLKIIDNYSVVEAELLTGRTHQIRVHFAYLHHPIVGDNLYDKQLPPLYLHCYFIEFMHPLTKNIVSIKNYPSWVKMDNEK